MKGHRVFLVCAALCVPVFVILFAWSGNKDWIGIGLLSGIALALTTVLWRALAE